MDGRYRKRLCGAFVIQYFSKYSLLRCHTAHIACNFSLKWCTFDIVFAYLPFSYFYFFRVCVIPNVMNNLCIALKSSCRRRDFFIDAIEQEYFSNKNDWCVCVYKGTGKSTAIKRCSTLYWIVFIEGKRQINVMRRVISLGMLYHCQAEWKRNEKCVLCFQWQGFCSPLLFNLCSICFLWNALVNFS